MTDCHPLEWHEECHPYSTIYGDHFFSRSGGREECRHVFIEGNRLPERWSRVDHFVIGELGFGTGLNFLETWSLWQQLRMPGQQLDSFENSPLNRDDMSRALSPWPDLQKLSDTMLPIQPDMEDFRQPFKLDPQTSLQIIIDDALTGVAGWGGIADAWYFDGFSPSRNPAMWSNELMSAIYDRTVCGGTFATYSAAGWVRRNLVSAGFTVQRVPGHANKRHMSIGHKQTS